MTERDYSELIEETLSSETVFHGRVFDTIVKKVRSADGSQSRREIVKHNGGACILPIDEDLNCYMVRQFRAPFERILLEVPAGKIEPGEDPKHSDYTIDTFQGKAHLVPVSIVVSETRPINIVLGKK